MRFSKNLHHTGLSELYMEIENLGDPITSISDRIDFKRIRSILSDLFDNDTKKGGRPNFDEITIIETLFIQELHGRSYETTERELIDCHHPERRRNSGMPSRSSSMTGEQESEKD